jgi:hypothetical protein
VSFDCSTIFCGTILIIICIRSLLRLEERSLGQKSSLTQRSKIQERHCHLLIRVTAFNRKAEHFLGDLDLDDLVVVEHENEDEESEEEVLDSGKEDILSEGDEEENDEQEDEVEWAEDQALLMPSKLGAHECHHLGLDDVMRQEIMLQEGQANDALEALHTALAEKSMLYRTKIQEWPSQKMSTHSWSAVQRVNGKIRQHVRAYNLAWGALLNMDADMPQFQAILKEDLKMSADVVEENRFGQWRDTLVWFWKVGPERDDDEGSWMDECEPCMVLISQGCGNLT